MKVKGKCYILLSMPYPVFDGQAELSILKDHASPSAPSGACFRPPILLLRVHNPSSSEAVRLHSTYKAPRETPKCWV